VSAKYAPPTNANTRSRHQHAAAAAGFIGLPGGREVPKRGQLCGDCSQAGHDLDDYRTGALLPQRRHREARPATSASAFWHDVVIFAEANSAEGPVPTSSSARVQVPSGWRRHPYRSGRPPKQRFQFQTKQGDVAQDRLLVRRGGGIVRLKTRAAVNMREYAEAAVLISDVAWGGLRHARNAAQVRWPSVQQRRTLEVQQR
jgi:hypothetical protein